MVYLIEAVGAGLVKIGFTDGDPADRLKQLQTGSAHPLRLRHTSPGTQLREKLLHQHFSHLRQNGEWFHMTVEVEVWMLVDRDFTPVLNALTERIERLEATVGVDGPLMTEIDSCQQQLKHLMDKVEGRTDG